MFTALSNTVGIITVLMYQFMLHKYTDDINKFYNILQFTNKFYNIIKFTNHKLTYEEERTNVVQ
jgi:hypothetical protein